MLYALRPITEKAEISARLSQKHIARHSGVNTAAGEGAFRRSNRQPRTARPARFETSSVFAVFSEIDIFARERMLYLLVSNMHQI